MYDKFGDMADSISTLLSQESSKRFPGPPPAPAAYQKMPPPRRPLKRRPPQGINRTWTGLSSEAIPRYQWAPRMSMDGKKRPKCCGQSQPKTLWFDFFGAIQQAVPTESQKKCRLLQLLKPETNSKTSILGRILLPKLGPKVGKYVEIHNSYSASLRVLNLNLAIWQ